MHKDLLSVPIIQVSTLLDSDSNHLFLDFSLLDRTKRKSHDNHPIIFLLNMSLITVIDPRNQHFFGSQQKSRQYKNSLLD